MATAARLSTTGAAAADLRRPMAPAEEPPLVTAAAAAAGGGGLPRPTAEPHFACREAAQRHGGTTRRRLSFPAFPLPRRWTRRTRAPLRFPSWGATASGCRCSFFRPPRQGVPPPAPLCKLPCLWLSLMQDAVSHSRPLGPPMSAPFGTILATAPSPGPFYTPYQHEYPPPSLHSALPWILPTR